MRLQFDAADLAEIEAAIGRAVAQGLNAAIDAGLARMRQAEARGEAPPNEGETAALHEYLVEEVRRGERNVQQVEARSLQEAIAEARHRRGWGGQVVNVTRLMPPEMPRASAPPVGTSAALPLPPGLVPVEPPPKLRKPRVNLAALLEAVGPKPEGYIARDEAVQLIGGDMAAQTALSNWITSKQVPAKIVCGGKLKPSKGLPGRVMVDKAAVLERNAQRHANVGRLPLLRRHRPAAQRQSA